MLNPKNNGTLIGRLSADPRVFENAKNGSKTVKFSVHPNDGSRQRSTNGIPVEAYVSDKVNGLGPYAHINKGDMVALATSLRLDTYVNKAGTKVYDLKVIVEDISFLESRAVTGARLAERVQQAQAAQAAQAASQAPVQNQAPAQPAAAAAAPAQPSAAAPAAAAATPAGDQAQFASAMNQHLPY